MPVASVSLPLSGNDNTAMHHLTNQESLDYCYETDVLLAIKIVIDSSLLKIKK